MKRIMLQINKALYILLLFCSFSLLPSFAKASLISIETSSRNVSSGERISVDVLVDPQNQSINSVESIIEFDTSIFSFNGFSLKQSSIPIWVEEPEEKKRGEVHFSGVIPGGIDRLYDPKNSQNTAIPIVRLFFIAKRQGIANFDVGDSLVLRNDGMGTATNVTSKSLSIEVQSNKGEKTNLLAEDNTLPKPFTVNIIERSVFGKTPRLAVFSAEDMEAGIERYEIAVGNTEFKKAESPFALPYRLFPYTLTARAYDYSGNFREQQITVGGEKPYGLGAILILALLCLLVFRFYRKVKRV